MQSIIIIRRMYLLTDAEETEKAPVLMSEVRAEAVKCPRRKKTSKKGRPLKLIVILALSN